MINSVVSIAGGKIAKSFGLEAALSDIKAAGFEYIDFWLCSYCEKQDAPMRQPDWKSWVESTAALIKAYGLKVGQCHAHWRLKDEIAEDFGINPPTKTTLRCFEASEMLGTHRLVFHPLERWMPLDTNCPADEARERILKANAVHFGEMLPEAEKHGVEIHIENLFDHKKKYGIYGESFPCGTAEDLIAIGDMIGSDRIRFCLDTGHANINGLDVPAMIRKLGKRLGSLHLNDNFGHIGPVYEDLHLFPGYGLLDWKEIFAALEETGYDGTINCEPNGQLGRMPRDIRVSQLKAAREILEAMRDGRF
ncbi:MAG: sugar phosphate isomerase/epimerase [Clostridia bacterium]|nr:sugar phosphate isomerase/epimerase [Clostridia bacterium]